MKIHLNLNQLTIAWQAILKDLIFRQIKKGTAFLFHENKQKTETKAKQKWTNINQWLCFLFSIKYERSFPRYIQCQSVFNAIGLGCVHQRKQLLPIMREVDINLCNLLL